MQSGAILGTQMSIQPNFYGRKQLSNLQQAVSTGVHVERLHVAMKRLRRLEERRPTRVPSP